MRKHRFARGVLAIAALGAGVQSAAATPVNYNWTGFYVGANVGYGVARNPSASTLFDGSLDYPETFNLSPRGVLGGGQVGYNWQAAPNWVVGIEADLQATGQKDSTTCVTTCIVDYSTKIAQKLPWFGTLRGRVGWTNGPALYYLTGGFAHGKLTTNLEAAAAALGPDSRTFSHTQSGWTIGGGIETQLSGNWTAKIEYLYIDLGSVRDRFSYAPDPTFTYVETSAIRNHVSRLGLNYRFGNPITRPDVIHKAPPAATSYNWSGLYFGGNVGYGVARNPSRSTLVSVEFPDTFTFPETFNLAPRGAVGGGHVGYNWQPTPNWVFGVEADIQASGQKDSTTCVFTCRLDEAVNVATRIAQEMPWFGTLRGRFGWTNGSALYYLTGGWAYGKVTTDIAVVNGLGSPIVDSRSFSHTNSGWALGGGIEAQVAGNWTAKIEYLYIDLGNVSDSFAYAPAPAISRYVESSSIRNHVARLGVNYMLGVP